MPSRTSAGPASPPKKAAPPPPAALNGPGPTSAALAPRDQKRTQAGDQSAYEPGKPIRFVDEEVEKMHNEIDKRAESDRAVARRALRHPSPRRSPGVGLRGFLVRVALLYLAIAYFVACPHDPKREYAVCRGIDTVGARARQLEPHVRPYVVRAQRKLQPYVAEVQHRTQPYVDTVKPYYDRADRLVRPRLATASARYRSTVYPALAGAVVHSQELTRPLTRKVKTQYTKSLAPSVEWYTLALERWYAAQLAPHVDRASSSARSLATSAQRAVAPVWQNGVPAAQHHWRAHLVPFSRSAYGTSRRTYVSHVHPRLVTAWRTSHGVYRSKVLPALQRFWSRFIAPQLAKIQERVYEYKAKRAKLDAIERVDKATDKIAQEHADDDIEDFINELRNDGANTDVDVDAAPAIPAEQAAPPAYSSSVPPPPPSAEDAAAQRASQRAALEALQSTYETEIAALGQAEHRLLVNRLADIRSTAAADIPKRFDAALEDLDDEGDKMVGRLGKYFARVAGDDKHSVDDKVRDADDLAAKAVARVAKAAGALEAEVDEYRRELEEREEAAVWLAKKSVSDLVSKATDELGRGWTWLDGTSAKDWQRYHGLRRAEENLHKSFVDLQSGAIKDASLSAHKPFAVLDEYRQQPAKLVKAFETILAKIKVKGQRELKGEWLGVVPEAQKAYDAVTGKLGGVVDDLKLSASSVAGYEPKPTNVAQSVSSLAKAAQASASSLAAEAVSALPTVEAYHEYRDAAKSALGDASQQVLRAVGVEPSPTDIRQTAASIAHAAQASAATAYAEASQSALRALGKEPSPTDLPQSMTSIANVASASAASAYSQVVSDYPSSISSALAAATQAVDDAAAAALSSASSVAASAASVVASLAAPAATMINAGVVVDRLGDVKEAANEFFGDVSQDALRAVGVEPSPTNLAQSATSVAQVVRSAVSPAPAVSRSASSIASAASRSSSSSSSALSRSASSASSVVSRSLSSASKEGASASSSVASRVSSVAQSVKSVASSLNKPHPSYRKSQAAASVVSATDRVKRAAGAKVPVARRAATAQPVAAAASAAPAAESSVSSVASQVSTKAEQLASPHPSYKASQRQEKIVRATDKVKQAVVHGEL
ncbi:uncharacterized protein RHOBADRAFT_54164 [Rhodotorula graminis WP1]|uniref:Transcription factor hoxa13 n=1 Tax=Rhodotorula graminis (strain WP1) TaxID=578459 RepID=A0A194S0R7_RHOGW|nr:uncharacterized protein RHOBADRAFT_54164 [Rhodotorula graminis WP1]KPV74323.1 hypothetical protein RHOBADRAFT_54164 [Rhodotorula graminis WP1]